jgi:hypothetical protein
MEIASSLKERNDFPVAYSLALWERYLRVGLEGVVGLPVMVTSYDDLLADAAGWCTRASNFLSQHGFKVTQPDPKELASFVNRGLRHSELGIDALIEHKGATDSQRELFEVLRNLVGTHDRMRRPELPPEAPGTEALLASHRAVVTRSGDQWLVPVV